MAASTAASRQAYWRRQIRRIALLLAVWAFVAFGLSIFLAEPLNTIHLGGLPLGFWMAQQGSIFVFVLLILLYAITSDRTDRAFGLHETEETTAGASDAH
ncbi:MAG: DUF4212 domain-containing protein [Bacteroidetes bacterium]|nr:sodium:solute symporter [Rhodothermaceae bacterium RA]RMH62499.1 MAG: DUF4212 domain-containing protein [Bacteroidota bacterium]